MQGEGLRLSLRACIVLWRLNHSGACIYNNIHTLHANKLLSKTQASDVYSFGMIMYTLFWPSRPHTTK